MCIENVSLRARFYMPLFSSFLFYFVDFFFCFILLQTQQIFESSPFIFSAQMHNILLVTYSQNYLPCHINIQLYLCDAFYSAVSLILCVFFSFVFLRLLSKKVHNLLIHESQNSNAFQLVAVTILQKLTLSLRLLLLLLLNRFLVVVLSIVTLIKWRGMNVLRE